MTDPTSDQLRAALTDIVGASAVLAEPQAAPLLTDFRGVFEGNALMVVRPGSPAEVASVVEACAAEGTAMVTQGGNSGMSGGAIPSDDHPAVLVSMSRMRAIESVDRDGSTMTVQAGATIADMQEAAAGVGRLFAPDWAARGSATIGGAVATDAGGNNVLRYGNMREQVLGIEAVLADGRTWNGLRALRKDSSGYDLKQLFIGSEGTLGIVTRVVVKLHPATPYQRSALAAVSDLEGLMALYENAERDAPGAITAFELMPEVALAQACKVHHLARPMKAVEAFYVLVRLASSRPVDELLSAVLEGWASADLITDAVVASTTQQEEGLWRIREELTPARIYPETQQVGVKMDVAVPIQRLSEFHEAVQDITAEIVPDAFAYGFGHVGDGNIHMMVLPMSVDDVDTFVDRRSELVARIDEATFRFGGTLSAEHGIGRLLNERVEPQKSELEWELMKTVKNALDPRGLMNPGVLFR